MTYFTLDTDGKTPIELPEGVYPDNETDHKIARDVLPNGKVVSTIFLTLDHNHIGGEPILFETMVFPTIENFTDLDGDRYTSHELAIAGHSRLVKEHS
jgi:hypothetical protein